MNTRATDGDFGFHEESPQTKELRATLPDEATCDRMAMIAGALADPTRIRLLSVLSTDTCCVGDLALVLGLSQSAVSHQLRHLKALGLVRSRRRGKHIFYALAGKYEPDVVTALRAAAREGTLEAGPT